MEWYFWGCRMQLVKQLGKSVHTYLAGLAVAFAFRQDLFNIGVEGQLIVGWFAAAYVGMAFELPKIIHLPFALISSSSSRGIMGIYSGYFKSEIACT